MIASCIYSWIDTYIYRLICYNFSSFLWMWQIKNSSIKVHSIENSLETIDFCLWTIRFYFNWTILFKISFEIYSFEFLCCFIVFIVFLSFFRILCCFFYCFVVQIGFLLFKNRKGKENCVHFTFLCWFVEKKIYIWLTFPTEILWIYQRKAKKLRKT